MSGLIYSPIVSSAPNVTRYTTAGAHTWHKPNNISKVMFECVAGGGGDGAGGNSGSNGVAGTANTGGGGGSGNDSPDGANGGSGIVVVRGPSAVTFAGTPCCAFTGSTHPGGDKIAKFTANGTLTIS